MDLQQILAALLNPNGGQQQNRLAMAGAPTQVGDHNNPALLQQAQQALAQGGMPPQMQAPQQPQMPPQAGVNPINSRPILDNGDRSYSTEESITVTDPRLNSGRPTNIPSIWSGRRTANENEAVTEALRSGQQFGAFNSIPEAVSAAKARSQSLNAGVPGGSRAPAGNGGGIGGFLSGLLQGPKAAEKNHTIGWLQKQGMDEGTATLLAGSKPALQQYLLSRSQGQKPIEVNGKLVDPSTMQVLADFSTPKSRNTTTINGKLVDADTGKVIGDYGQENKPPASYQEYQLAKQDGFDGTYTDWQTKSVREQDPTFGREKDLRQEYENNPNVKNYQIVRDNYERIRQGAQQTTGAGDIAIVFGYMKMLDPTSVVRENEQATAQNAAGVPAAVRNMWNSVFSGEKLSPEARQQLVAAGQQVYTEASQNLGDLNTRYGDIATNWELDPSRIIQPPEQYDPLALPQDAPQPGQLPLPPPMDGGAAPQAAPPVAAPSPAGPSPQRFGDPTQGVIDWQDWFKKRGR